MSDFKVTINSLTMGEDGLTVIAYAVDYQGTSVGTTVADLGAEPTVESAEAHIKTLYNLK